MTLAEKAQRLPSVSTERRTVGFHVNTISTNPAPRRLIAPLAFFMGLPFPLALVRVAAAQPGLVPWAWGINGCASVLSAILAILLAMSLGFSAVLLIAIGLYLVAAATLR